MPTITSTMYIRIAFFIVKICFFKPRAEIERECARKMRQFVQVLKKSYTEVHPNGKKIHAVINIFDLSLHEASIIHRTIGKNKANTYIHLYSQNGSTFGASYAMSNSQLRFIVIKICIELLARNNSILLHASSLRINDKVYIFTGDSGAGKSTIVKLLGTAFIPFTDELLVIQRTKNGYVVGQSFFAEKNKKIKADPFLYPLHSFYFIHQSKQTRVTKIKNKQLVLRKLSKQLRTDSRHGTTQFAYITRFVDTFPSFFDLFFEKNKRATVALFSHHNKRPAANNIHDH